MLSEAKDLLLLHPTIKFVISTGAKRSGEIPVFCFCRHQI